MNINNLNNFNTNFNNNFDNNLIPNLTEPGVKCYLSECLKKCHKYKEKYNNLIYNILLFLEIILIIIIILLIKYKGKLTPQEKIQKDEIKKKYILSKIINYRENKLKEQQKLISGLPLWEKEY